MIRILQPGDEALLEAFLQPRIESSLFLLGNMRAAGLADNGRPYQGTYAAMFEDDHIIGVAALYWNGSLILQSPIAYVGVLSETAVPLWPPRCWWYGKKVCILLFSSPAKRTYPRKKHTRHFVFTKLGTTASHC